MVYLFSLQHYNCICVTVSHSVISNSLWPKDCSELGTSVYGILQARILEWIAVLSPGHLPNLGMERVSPALQADSLHLSHQGSPIIALGEGKGNQLQYSCLENPMDRGAWWTTVPGIEKSWTWLSDWARMQEGTFIPYPKQKYWFS